jgi:hypothetical protein
MSLFPWVMKKVNMCANAKINHVTIDESAYKEFLDDTTWKTGKSHGKNLSHFMKNLLSPLICFRRT